MKSTIAFWRTLAIALLVMCLVELAGLYNSVTKLEGYYAEVHRLENVIAAIRHSTNSPYVLPNQ